MSRQTINGTFTLEIPEHFEILTADKLREMYRNVGDPFGWGARDAENHTVMLAMWKKYPAILSWALDLKVVVKKNEQLTRSAHAGSGYRLLEFFSMRCGTEEAEGYRFCYEKDGNVQVSSNYLIRDGKTIYAFMCVGREANLEADRKMFDQVMGTLSAV